MKSDVLKWANTIALAAMLVVNMLANLLPIGIGNTGEISKKYPNLFTPAPMTFAIWGLIYLCMVAFVLYQWGIFDHNYQSTAIRNAIGLWFVISCLMNIGWILTWHNNKIVLSVILMFGLMISLMMILGRLEIPGHNRLSALTVGFGFDLYLGWIVAASIANVNVWLTSIHWQRFGLSEPLWTILLLLLGAALTYAMVLSTGHRVIGLSVIWAFVGILNRHISPKELNGEYPNVIVFAFVAILIVLMSMLIFSEKISMLLYHCPIQSIDTTQD